MLQGGILLHEPANHGAYAQLILEQVMQRTIQLAVIDNGCQMGPNLCRTYPDGIAGIRWAVGYLHGSAHITWCQLANQAVFVESAGRVIGKNLEHLWAELKAATKCLRSVAHPLCAAEQASAHRWQV